MSTFNVGMGKVQNGRLYLRYGSSPVISMEKLENCTKMQKPEMLQEFRKKTNLKFKFCFPFSSFYMQTADSFLKNINVMERGVPF